MADETQPNEVARYAAAVREALSDMSASKRDLVLEDLEDHLNEVAAESGLPLASRLGPPEEYAAELRAAYGAEQPVGRRRFPRTRRFMRSAQLQVSGWRGYRAVQEYLPELRPAWWVLRAYLAVLVVTVILRGDETIHPIPNPFSSSGLLELVAMAVAIAFSVKLGRWSRGRDGRVMWPLRAGNALVGLSGLLALGSMSTLPSWVNTYSAADSSGTPDVFAAAPVTNIYVYTVDGKPIEGVLLYDQDGRPLNVNAGAYGIDTRYPTAADGQPITNEYPQAQTGFDGAAVVPPRVAIPPASPSPSPSPTPSPSPSPSPVK
jgi:HAAS domain-containing protein